jgi:hypothetical protein
MRHSFSEMSVYPVSVLTAARHGVADFLRRNAS